MESKDLWSFEFPATLMSFEARGVRFPLSGLYWDPVSAIMGVASGLSLIMGAYGTVSSGMEKQAALQAQQAGIRAQEAAARRTAEYNQQMTEFNADLARQQAEIVRAAGAREAAQRRAEGEKLLSKQQVLFDTAGVDTGSGSPLTVMMDTAAGVERDILASNYNYEVKARQEEAGASIWDTKSLLEGERVNQPSQSFAKTSMWPTLLGGAATLFKGASSIVSSQWGSPMTTKAAKSSMVGA
jgi:hypothetical protein